MFFIIFASYNIICSRFYCLMLNMRRKLTLVFLFLLTTIGITFAQKKVTGNVISAEDGQPVIGASVSVKGTGTGTVTDFDGNFSLSIPESVKKLTFTYVGMVTEEIPVQSVMNVKLRPDTQSLEEVVVTGYQKIDRKLFTGSADKIQGKDTKIEGMTDVSHMLQGRTAGVTVQNVSGTFGAAPKMKVRGSSSILGNQTPLWVVDGVILEDIVELSADALSSGDAVTLISSAVAGLNADDIESFQILKDASASALYGARAMNGVVVITTKRGKVGSATVNFTGEFGIRLKPVYRDYNIMNSQQQMDVYNEMDTKGWMNYSNINSAANTGIYGHMWSSLSVLDSDGNFALSADKKRTYLQSAEYRNTDWFNELFRETVTQNYAVSMSSGSEKNRNYASLSLYNDPGWTEADNVKRFTGNFNSATDLSKTVTLTLLTMGSIRDQKAPGTQQQNADPVSGEFSRDFDINPFSYALNTSRALDPNTFYKMNYAPFNIKNELKNNYMNITQMDLKFQADLAWKPVKGLEVNFLTSYRYVKSKTEEIIKENSNVAQAYRAGTVYSAQGVENSEVAKRNPFLYSDPDNPTANPQCVLPRGGIYATEEFEMKNLYLRGTANYNKTFEEVHATNFLLGAEMKSTERDNSGFIGYGYMYNEAIAATEVKMMKMNLESSFNYFGLVPTLSRGAAFFCTSSYSYLGKYILNLTGRVDGSNQLGENAQADWLPTWNVSGAWNAQEEAFMSNFNNVSQLRFRLTYGLNAVPAPGGSAMGVMRSRSTYRASSGDNEIGTYIESLPNYNLTWEKQYELDFGVELGLWKNRLNLSLDIFDRNSYDLVALVPVSGYGGKSQRVANYAGLTNKGFEFSLGGGILDLREFKWNSNLTFSYVKNKITDLKSNPSVLTLVSAYGGDLQGYPTKSIFSLQFKGLTEDGIPQVVNEQGRISSTGVNFQESRNLQHLVYEGPTDAPYQGGFNNDFTYKNWRMSVFFTYQFGNVVRLDPAFKASYSDVDVTPKEMKNRWAVRGDEKYTNIPVLLSYTQYSRNSNYAQSYNAYNYSDVRIAKGDYIRLKDIFVSYDFNSNLIKTLNLNTLQLKLSASNIALLYADKKLNGQDPEFFKSGGVAMPNPRQITMSLKVGF